MEGAVIASDAAGQLLGYTIQFPRALLRLLEAKPGDRVGVEFHGDVSQFYSDGSVLSEEDKSSLGGNPVTNKSTNLWKTFYNWALQIENGAIDVDNTTFVLYANKIGLKSLVDDFHTFSDLSMGDVLTAKIRKVIEPLEADHAIQKYYDFLVNQHHTLFLSILQRFQFEANEGELVAAILKALKAKHVRESHLEYLMETICGWLVNTIIGRIQSGYPGLVTWEEFDKRFMAAFERVRTKELIDVTLKRHPTSVDIDAQVADHPIYLKQLDLIELPNPEKEKIVAITDFLRASINRMSWISDGIIDQETALEFENHLGRYWSNERKSIALTNPGLNTKQRGQLLYYRCRERQQPIRDMNPPDCTIPGTYHALANEPVLGWHNDWADQFEVGDGDHPWD